MEISAEERRLINEVIKAFVNNQWCITPEAIASFMRQYGENISVEKVFVAQQENTN